LSEESSERDGDLFFKNHLRKEKESRIVQLAISTDEMPVEVLALDISWNSREIIERQEIAKFSYEIRRENYAKRERISITSLREK